MAADFLEEAEGLDLVRWRRDFHRHPELGFQEHRTAGIVSAHLEARGYEVTTGIAETGVVGVLEGARPGPVVMVRADMDALPLDEESDHDYVSTIPGVMHACGHDGHTAIGMGVASLLARHRSELAGTVKLVFQPAEEGLGGAARMIEEGVLERPRPDVVLGVHISSFLPTGTVSVGDGPVLAASDRFAVSVRGRGGHGAMPHQTVDATVAAARIVVALQDVVGSADDPSEMAVVTVGRLSAGTAANIIADTAAMEGTIRTFTDATRDVVIQRMRDIVSDTAAAMHAEARLTLSGSTPAVVNDPAVADRVRHAAIEVVGTDRVTVEQRLMASEDFACFAREVPGCYLFLGGGRSSEEYPHHHPKFDFDETVLAKGVAIVCRAVFDSPG